MDEKCENCNKICENDSLLKHISHTRHCKIFYGDRYIQMLAAKRKINQSKSHEKHKVERNEKRRKKINEEDMDVCKACEKAFPKSKFLNHLSDFQDCKLKYGGEEYIDNEVKKKIHNDNSVRKNNEDWIKAWYETCSDSDIDENDSENEGVVLKCNGCGIEFTHDRFYRHVSHSMACKNAYGEEKWTQMKKERRKFQNWTNHRKYKEKYGQKKKEYYESNKKQFTKWRKDREKTEIDKNSFEGAILWFKDSVKISKERSFLSLKYELDPFATRLSKYKEEIKRFLKICSTDVSKRLVDLENHLADTLKNLKSEFDSIVQEVNEKTGNWKFDKNGDWRIKYKADDSFASSLFENFKFYSYGQIQMLGYYTKDILKEIADDLNEELFTFRSGETSFENQRNLYASNDLEKFSSEYQNNKERIREKFTLLKVPDCPLSKTYEAIQHLVRI